MRLLKYFLSSPGNTHTHTGKCHPALPPTGPSYPSHFSIYKPGALQP